MNKALVIFQPEGKRVEVDLEENLLDAARNIGLELRSVCGGRGLCGKCRVRLQCDSGLVSPTTDFESKILSEDELGKGYRLACCVRISGHGPVVVEVPPESMLSRQRLLVSGIEVQVEPKPAVRKIVAKLVKPTLGDVGSDDKMLFEALSSQAGVRDVELGFEAVGVLPSAIRDGNWTVTVALWMGRRLIWVEPKQNIHRNYGFAVDIGTTKLAGYLVDLNSGTIVASSSTANPQIPYGEDVISRISYTTQSPENLGKLQSTVVDAVNRLIKEACEQAKVKREEIYDMTAVGNTAMHHIFLGITPKFVALSPYPPALVNPIEVKSKYLGLSINPAAYIHMLPPIAGFVGSDALASVLSTGIYKSEKTSMLIDVGTNTEIILGGKSMLLACSCASGPAFEGAHIKYGMRAATGAIEQVHIDPSNFEVTYRTIDEAKPCGLCGSAVVDAVAEMLRASVMDSNGRINMKLDTPRIRVRNGAAEFVLAWRNETNIGDDIVITQADIREIQLAKAAIYTGSSILMKKLGVKASDLEMVFIAGAFGTYIDPLSARTIGMYPDVFLECVSFVGNSAGSGAVMALLSTEVREKAKEIQGRIRYVELAGEPDFKQEFIDATYFPHREVERFPNVSRLLKK